MQARNLPSLHFLNMKILLTHPVSSVTDVSLPLLSQPLSFSRDTIFSWEFFIPFCPILPGCFKDSMPSSSFCLSKLMPRFCLLFNSLVTVYTIFGWSSRLPPPTGCSQIPVFSPFPDLFPVLKFVEILLKNVYAMCSFPSNYLNLVAINDLH